MNLRELHQLDATTINDIDLLFLQESGSGEFETKNGLVSDLELYILSSSNLINSLKTGSFTGSFSGTLIGTSNTSSISKTSNYSVSTKNLIFPNNSTASYSIQSISSSKSNTTVNSDTSSYSLTSSYSDSASYVSTFLILSSSNSKTSSYSTYSNYANSTDYLIYNNNDNGKVYRSILSDFSPTCSYAQNLAINNTSTAHSSISASIAGTSSFSKYINLTQVTNVAESCDNSDSQVFAYVNFDISRTSPTGPVSFYVNEWKNIQSPGIGVAAEGPECVVFTSSFYEPLPSGVYSSAVCDLYVSSYPASDSTPGVQYFFKSYSFPIKNTGFGVALRCGNFFGRLLSVWSRLNNANVSIVVYAPSSDTNYPTRIPATSTTSNSTLLGCARLS
jgi:hypothetical protein